MTRCAGGASGLTSCYNPAVCPNLMLVLHNSHRCRP